MVFSLEQKIKTFENQLKDSIPDERAIYKCKFVDLSMLYLFWWLY